jgi:hypothetical protein
MPWNGEKVLPKYHQIFGFNFTRRANSSFSELDDEIKTGRGRRWRACPNAKVFHLVLLCPSIAFMRVIKTHDTSYTGF